VLIKLLVTHVCEALPQEFLGSLSMYIHLKYLSTSHHEHIGVVHVVVLNYNTTQIDGYFVLSNKPYEGIVLLIKGFLLVPSMMELVH
jgi:hypothetical protein